jgi:hypothetical protein
MRCIALTSGPTLVMTLLAACTPQTPAASRTDSASTDTGFTQVQRRGRVAMGVDQYSSTHDFQSLPDGGRITLTRNEPDTAGVNQIRAHMPGIAAAFGRGDFDVPGFVHARAVPGTAVMASRRSRISYHADTVPLGGALRIYSTDSLALMAIHQFLAFQRQDHRSPHVVSH